MPEGGEP